LTKGKALSIAQERLWVLERLYPGNPAHNVSYALRLTGPVDIDRLERAWNGVVRQYEILRTGFQTIDGVPRAVSVASGSAPFNKRDLQGVSTPERELSLMQLARDEARRPFDLSCAPLLRASLYRYHLSRAESVLLVVAHRIVCDEASLEILLRETASHYEAFARSKVWTAAPAMQYSEFISRQGKFSEKQIAYWKQRLEGVPASLDLPIDRARPAEQTFSGASHTFSIPKSEVEQLRNLDRSHGASLFVTLLSVFDILLSRYSRQDDLMVGTQVSGRIGSEAEKVIGPLENLLVLRTDLSGNPSLVDLLVRNRDVVAAAFAHQDVLFEVLLEQLPLDRDLSRNPLFQVAFQLHRFQLDRPWSADVNAVPFAIESGIERFDLSLDLSELSDSIEAKLSYNTDVFENSTITRMAEHFSTLVAGAAADPGCRIFDLQLLGDV
jgi:hypothetical protein